VGNYYEVANGVVTKYYFAGSQRIALRSNGTLNYLLSDHLGSTSLTTSATGTVIAELRYKAWGEVRYASGTTPTKYTFTGQYSDSDFGLLFYNARWVDSSVGRFAQADTIAPGGVQGYDRYAYANNAPTRYIDPSGHRNCQEDGYNCPGDRGPLLNATQTLNQYGIILVGNYWTSQYTSYVLAGVRVTANTLGRERNMDPIVAFKAVYGITPESPFRFVMGSCDAREGKGGCADKNGQKAGAYTWSSREVEFYYGQPFAQSGGNRSGSETYGLGVHEVVHELGHAFASRFDGGSPSNPYTMIGAKMFDDGQTPYTSDRGFRSSPDPVSASGYWRPNSSTEAGETFANMFLGWVYGAWSNDSFGDQRGSYMTTNMADTWLPILTR
jgi:RHS repeat-associated protein